MREFLQARVDEGLDFREYACLSLAECFFGLLGLLGQLTASFVLSEREVDVTNLNLNLGVLVK